MKIDVIYNKIKSNVTGSRIGMRIQSGFDWAAYWAAHLYAEDDLLLNFDSRNGNILTDSVSGETAEILLPCFVNNGAANLRGDKTRASELLFDGNDHTIYFQFKLIGDISAGNYDLMSLGGWALATRRGIKLVGYFDRIRMYSADGTILYTDDLITASATAILLNNGVFDFVVKIDGTGKTLKAAIYNSDGVLQGVEINRDISAFAFNTDQNYTYFNFNQIVFVVDNFKKFSGIKNLVQCQTDTYVTGLAIHLPHVLSCIDISGNGNEFSHAGTSVASIRYDFINEWMLKYGYDYYYISTAGWFPQVIPYTAVGGVTRPSYAAGAPWVTTRIIGERPGTTSMLNLYDFGKIRFTNAFFDRSNATIWNDNARGADYDAVNTKDFLISSLNYRTLYGWLNDGYRGRLYINYTLGSVEQFDRQLSLLSNIYLYSTDHKGTGNRNILAYTKDLKCAVLSGTTITYDAENYVKIGTLKSIKPMLSFRVDDGLDTTITQWYPYFETIGIKSITAIVQEMIGTGGFMTLAQIKTLYNAVWDVAFHANLWAADYTNPAYVLLLEPDLAGLKVILDANESPYTYLVGARYSSGSPSLGYYANKYSLKANLASVGLGGSNNGANPQAIDKFNLSGISIDLDGDYNLNVADPSTAIANIEAQIDLCESSNRWLICFVHGYVAKVKDGIDIINAYAASKGLTNISISEGLLNCKYL